MNDNYLNLKGLTQFLDRLKSLFITRTDIKELKGEDGISVTSVEQTTSSAADDGMNTITVTLSDGTRSAFHIKNGSKGSTGAKGDTGNTGAQGPKGNTGAAGTRGSMIYWGTAVTGTSTAAAIFSGSGISSALTNDLYINTSTWNIYQCTAAGAASTAKWTYKGNIKGAAGAAGANATTTSVATTSANGLMSKEMVQKIHDLNDSLTDTGWIQVNEYLMYRKWGKVLTIRVNDFITKTANWETVGTLPFNTGIYAYAAAHDGTGNDSATIYFGNADIKARSIVPNRTIYAISTIVCA